MTYKTETNKMKIENNKLIAEFMGHTPMTMNEYHNRDNCLNDDNILWIDEQCYYDSKWDWLMPVVEKIEEIALEEVKGSYKIHRYRIDTSYCQCNIVDTKTDEIIIENDAPKLTAIYLSVVEFIKLNNKNKKETA